MKYIIEVKESEGRCSTGTTVYKKFDTKEEAVNYFKKFVTKFPSIANFKLYESHEIEGLPMDFLEEALVSKKKEEARILQENFLSRLMEERYTTK